MKWGRSLIAHIKSEVQGIYQLVITLTPPIPILASFNMVSTEDMSTTNPITILNSEIYCEKGDSPTENHRGIYVLINRKIRYDENNLVLCKRSKIDEECYSMVSGFNHLSLSLSVATQMKNSELTYIVEEPQSPPDHSLSPEESSPSPMSGCRRFLHVKRLARQHPYQTHSHNPVIPLSDITNVISDNPNLAEEAGLNMPPTSK